MNDTAEHRRLLQYRERKGDWKNWGPYLSDRAWGTVREDYSADGTAWDYFPHDHARSRAYRWNEDGIAGFSNRYSNICLSVAMHNGLDPILKERLFGVAGPEGNHGEDVKEYYFHLDGTPTHSYMRMLYKYPQVAFPYGRLVDENRRRDRDAPEFELIDALRDAFAAGQYFDVDVEYAKVTPEDLVCRISVTNRGRAAAPIALLPQLWFRNTWSWGEDRRRPTLTAVGPGSVLAEQRRIGRRWWSVEAEGAQVELLFTENDTNHARLFGSENEGPYVKDGFDRYVVHGEAAAVRRDKGTKAAALVRAVIGAGETLAVHVRFADTDVPEPTSVVGDVVEIRRDEADAFYAALHPPGASADERLIQRQAFAGLMWNKQHYHYSVELWLDGDSAQPSPPASRLDGRNNDWRHLYNNEVLSMPDKWEYPWFAAWDLAFHAVPIAMIDPDWAKRQILLLLREWYMHPNGAIPAYEWAFSDVNPPVHAWAAWQVYKTERELTGERDTEFLERVFQKLLLNFTWWVNRKDRTGRNAFQGGFLGLDNIGVFDRSKPLPTGGYLEQADGTAWMAMYCLNMLGIALELAVEKPAYEDIATKFFEHFIYIAHAANDMRGEGVSLWDERDGFYYDVLASQGQLTPLRIRSFVGLIPLFAVGGLHPRLLDRLPHFRRRVEWFVEYRPELMALVGAPEDIESGSFFQLSIVNRDKLERILRRVLDADEFLSDYGLRSLSKYHAAHPYRLEAGGSVYSVRYEPAESRTEVFGGNSNWRGPIWFPINYLMIESLRKYHLNFGDDLMLEFPTGSGRRLNLGQIADELAGRLAAIFTERDGGRAVFGGEPLFNGDPHFRDHIPFYEYFDGDTGKGLGASHQTGWTALVARLIQGPLRVGLG